MYKHWMGTFFKNNDLNNEEFVLSMIFGKKLEILCIQEESECLLNLDNHQEIFLSIQMDLKLLNGLIG